MMMVRLVFKLLDSKVFVGRERANSRAVLYLLNETAHCPFMPPLASRQGPGAQLPRKPSHSQSVGAAAGPADTSRAPPSSSNLAMRLLRPPSQKILSKRLDLSSERSTLRGSLGRSPRADN